MNTAALAEIFGCDNMLGLQLQGLAKRKEKPRYERVYCSSCGGEFGPADHGYSHCEHHAGLVDLDNDGIQVGTALELVEKLERKISLTQEQ